MSQKKKMINQLGEIWKLAEGHCVSKTFQPCGATAMESSGISIAEHIWPVHCGPPTSQ